MTTTNFLDELLLSQQLSDAEKTVLEQHKGEIEGIIRDKFGDIPHISHAGSYIKETMIRDSYDLDIICYFPRESDENPETLEEIYNSVKELLEDEYEVEEKTSAIRVKHKIADTSDYHIDVVPGRYIEGSEGDVFLYKTSDGDRIQTNIDVHVDHIKNSGRADVIRLLKLWSIRNNLYIRTFVLELFVIKILEGKSGTLEEEFTWVLEGIVEKIENIQLVDPANTANIVSDLISSDDKKSMSKLAKANLSIIQSAIEEGDGISASVWEQIFQDNRKSFFYSSIQGIHVSHTPSISHENITPNKPWRPY